MQVKRQTNLSKDDFLIRLLWLSQTLGLGAHGWVTQGSLQKQT